MTLLNCFLAPWNPPKALQRLRHLVLWPSETAFWHLEILLRPRSASSSPSGPQQCLRDCSEPLCFLWPSETDFWHPETLLRPRSASRTFFYDPPKLLFGTLKLETLLRPRSASGILFYDPPKVAFDSLKPSLGLAAPPAVPQTSAMPQRLLQSGPRRHRVPWPHSVWPSETDFWHPETLLTTLSCMTLRNCFLAPWNPPKASQRLRHLVLWPFENTFWHLETFLRPRSASSSPSEPQQCPAPAASCFMTLRNCLLAAWNPP